MTLPETGPLEPETADDGHTWLSLEYCQQEQMWAPADPQDMPAEWPAWRLPAWYAGRTGLVQVPGHPGQPGCYQTVHGGWLPWQSGADRYEQAEQWPTAERLTVGDMQAELWPPAPEPEMPPAPAASAEEPPAPEPQDVPPLITPTLGQQAAPERN